MKENYSCACCGRKNIKLWRPYGYSSPLICATCAEKSKVLENVKRLFGKMMVID